MDALRKELYAWFNGLLITTLGLMWITIWFIHILQLQVAMLSVLVVMIVIGLLSYAFKLSYFKWPALGLGLWIIIALLISWCLAVVCPTSVLLYLVNLWGWLVVVLALLWVYVWMHHWLTPRVSQLYGFTGLVIFAFVVFELMVWLGWLHLIVGLLLTILVIAWWATVQQQLSHWVEVSDDMLIIPLVFKSIQYSLRVSSTQLYDWLADGANHDRKDD